MFGAKEGYSYYRNNPNVPQSNLSGELGDVKEGVIKSRGLQDTQEGDTSILSMCFWLFGIF